MNRNTGRVSTYLLAVFMMGCLFCYSSFPVYADELPTSHPSCVVCKGQLSPQGRWCDNNNGTVTDMTNGLVWLKDAAWGGQYPLVPGNRGATTAVDRVSEVHNGKPASLKDGSQEGDWGLPTLKQLKSLITGTEAIQSSSPHFFTGVLSGYYWSSSTNVHYTGYAWFVSMGGGGVVCATVNKDTDNYVWPVRGGQ
ncbi:MAG: DUF1566 domain-containing protein [Deltaproteobacteria bacterium]|nr:DUF1566 domain-containing protein [Deltaproteobacteria bacterium]